MRRLSKDFKGSEKNMKSAGTHKEWVIETAVAAGLALSAMQLDSRCITAGTWSPALVTGMNPTRFKGT